MNGTPLRPFGLEVPAGGRPLERTDARAVADAVAEHRLLVLRGVDRPSTEAMLGFCRRLGEILEWDFGAVNELRARPDARNYLFTPAAVPFHWDGAFVGKVPRYIFFSCSQAPPPGSGGETLFCDGGLVLERASPELRAVWERIRITYETEKVVHYGGRFTAPLVGRHPGSGRPVLRYAEPVEALNPVTLAVEGMGPREQAAFVDGLRERLYDPAVCLAHAWRDGDVVIADNHALLHGRRAYDPAAPRHLRRVNIL